MAIKKYKPTTPGQRTKSGAMYRTLLSGARAWKPLVTGRKRGTGRNNVGRITVRHKGGGHKRRFRDIDFVYDKKGITARYETVEYDPYRSSFIARALYEDGTRRYVLVPQQVSVGDTFIVAEAAPIAPGNRLPLRNIPVGTFVYNVELQPGAGARLARSAGNYAEVIAHDSGYAQLKMPSTEVRKVLDTVWASVGEVSNEMHKLVSFGKAGRSRWKGIRPTVRGTAMNPVDHAHGGGEGRQGRGRRRAVSFSGKPTGKGQKTRRAKKYSNKFIVSRRRVGKKRKA